MGEDALTPGRSTPAWIAVAVTACSLLAAGCGGGGGSAHVATIGTTTAPTTQTETGAVAFARCMRAHGIPNWPDPTSAGVFDKAKLLQLGISPARVRALEEGPCNHLLPDTGGGSQETVQQAQTRRADALSFARCMRRHGVTRFPDPDPYGQLSVEMVQAQGIDVHAPAFLRVVQACLPASHGALTPAKVREALAGA